MGNPRIYYKEILQNFAYGLVSMENRKLAESFLGEDSVEKLEEFISEKKTQIEEKQFYFEAGRAVQLVLDESDNNDGCDGFNACIGGCNDFAYFIGLRNG